MSAGAAAVDAIFRASAGLARGGDVFMLVDAARAPVLAQRLEPLAGFGRARSLYQGDVGAGLGHVLPWIVRLDRAAPETLWFAEAGFGEAWGSFVVAELPLEDVRRHLRKFNLVTLPDGRTVVFRFSDPRVLRGFLPACSPAELVRFFGPVKGFLAETAEGEGLLRWTLDAGRLRQATLALAAAPA